MNTLPLTELDLAVSAVLVAVAGLVSVLLGLGVTSRLGVAALRTVLQLALLGLVLEWVFAVERWYVVLGLVASMVVNAGVAAVRRTDRRFPGIWSGALWAVAISSVITTFAVTELVVGIQPWYQPRYLLPLLGMVLGNSLTGLSLALDRLMSDLDERRAEVEGWLALGASAWEACRPFVRDAVRTGMIPIINSMTVVGIVSLPGMMTGQILAGEDPADAVKYQIVVMFMIAAAASLGSMLAAIFTYRRLVTRDHQLAHHKLQKRETS